MAEQENLLLDIEEDSVVVSRETASSGDGQGNDGSSDFV